MVATDGRTGLSLSRCKFVHLACRFVDQGQHDRKGQFPGLQHFGREGVTVVDEVAGKDGGQMQVATPLAVEFEDVWRQGGGQHFHPFHRGIAVGFQKQRDVVEINQTLL